MVKTLLLLLKYGSLTMIDDIIFFFRRLTGVLMSGFDNLDYNILQPIRLLRFEDVRDFVFSTEGIIIITVSLLVIVILVSKKRF
jgi:hypothetical protein